MTKRGPEAGLDFEALRLAIERSDPEAMLGFYAEDARLSILSARAPKTLPFELSGKAEIAKHLRATFVQGSLHRVEHEVVGEDRVTFREACEYLDGDRIVVQTTLEVRDGRIVRQLDVVASDARASSQEGRGREPPT